PVFVVIGSVTVAGPVLFDLFASATAARPLDTIEEFMSEHNAVIMFVVLVMLVPSRCVVTRAAVRRPRADDPAGADLERVGQVRAVEPAPAGDRTRAGGSVAGHRAAAGGLVGRRWRRPGRRPRRAPRPRASPLHRSRPALRRLGPRQRDRHPLATGR